MFLVSWNAIIKSYFDGRLSGMTFKVWMLSPVLPAWVTWTNVGGWAALALSLLF